MVWYGEAPGDGGWRWKKVSVSRKGLVAVSDEKKERERWERQFIGATPRV